MGADFWKEKVVFITGASSGIGLELAKYALSRGSNVVMIARRKDLLLAFLNTHNAETQKHILLIEGDVTSPNDLENAAQKTVETFGKIDVCFANAGFAVVGPVHKLKLEDHQRQWETNVTGVLKSLYATLDALKNSSGVFCVTGSIAGHIALQNLGSYSMSKFAVRGLCESLRADLKNVKVRVVHLSCGFIETEIGKKDKYGKLRQGSKSMSPKELEVPVEKAIISIARAIETGDGDVVITNHGKAFVAANRFYPKLNRVANKLSKVSGN